MSGESKFSSKRPKGDAWGVEDSVARAAEEFRKTGRSPMIPFIGVLAVSKIEMTPGDDGEPVYVAVVEIRRANSLDSDESIRAGQKLLLRAMKEREGDDAVQSLPVDEREIIMQAFGGDLDSAEVEQDTKEAEEEALLPEPDKLRRHLVVCHGFSREDVDSWEMFDVHKTHDALHSDLPAETMPHDKEWWGWRRIVLEEKAAELRGEGVTWGTPEMDDEAEIKAHLGGYHEFADEALADLTLAELRQKHLDDHNQPDPDNPFPLHEVADLTASAPEVLDGGDSAAEDDQTAANPEAADGDKD